MSIRIRQMATVFLSNDSDWLLMKRAETRALAPGLWAGVGGHLESSELSRPELCALREMEEETGIRPDQIHNLRLQALLHRIRGNEIRLQYLYVGLVETREFHDTEEGTLHWVPRHEVLTKSMAVSTRAFFDRYFSMGPAAEIWVGTLGKQGTEPYIQWGTLEDWEPA